ncbi:ATP-binding protein [Moritella marina ATCC 15381]|uniref:ATP-binding protein n=1 Tax=Moritella marina ATCC 15381 TaxID=1202962 RepID=A0A5J6WL10_MORMI|nr:ATP-binding protein [Moritella marina]QFI38799.1 ATP-binding protein [Moritella marina ATCC 15381]
MSFQIAKYTLSKNSDYRGNPFIETLPMRLSASDFWDAVVDVVELPENIAELDVETLEQKAANIMKSVLPTSQYYDIYCDFLNILKEGYQERNPLNEDTQRWQNQVATENYHRTRTTAPSLKFTGFSGMGKTTLFNSLLTLIPPVLSHPKEGPMGKDVFQFVYIKVDIPGEADSKEICLIIAREIDKVLGTTDYQIQYEKLTRKRCISKVITLCSTLLIGVIIFDEIQNICFASPNERKQIFTLFDQLTQVAHVPTVKIGTSKANRLSEKEFTNARRLGIPHEWVNFSKLDIDWKSLVEYAWDYQLLPEFIKLTPALENKIYSLTQGIPYCLFFLIEQTNKHCIRDCLPCFSGEVFDHIFDSKFSIMKPAIIALRHGKFDAFDDLMNTNFELDQKVKKEVKKLLKIAAEHRFKGQEAKAIYEQVERYLPEYKLTKKEEQTVKILEKELAMNSSTMPIDNLGYEGIPL